VFFSGDLRHYLPIHTKQAIAFSHLWSDLFYDHKIFFEHDGEYDSLFLYSISNGFHPRIFTLHQDRRIIYEEEEHVSEMYFITRGKVGIGFSRNNNDSNLGPYDLSLTN
jgi:uncharacterized secreted protein with C-terminal beta-propeller domain